MSQADIIHPVTDRTTDGQFYAAWRRTTPKRIAAGQQRRSKMSDPEFVSRFRVMLRQGLPQKQVAAELGLSRSMVTYYRDALGISSRRLTLQEDGRYVNLGVTMPVGFYARLKRHCGNRTTMSAFVRSACQEKIAREIV